MLEDQFFEGWNILSSNFISVFCFNKSLVWFGDRQTTLEYVEKTESCFSFTSYGRWKVLCYRTYFNGKAMLDTWLRHRICMWISESCLNQINLCSFFPCSHYFGVRFAEILSVADVKKMLSSDWSNCCIMLQKVYFCNRTFLKQDFLNKWTILILISLCINFWPVNWN